MRKSNKKRTTVKKGESVSLKKQESLRREMNLASAINVSNNRRNDHQGGWRESRMNGPPPAFTKNKLEIARQNFNRSLDIKDHRTVGLMLKSLEEDEELYQKNFGAHVEAIDRLVGIYRMRMREYEKRYQNNLNDVVRMYKKERESIDAQQYDDQVLIRSIIFAEDSHQDLGSRTEDVRSIAKVQILREDNENSRRIAATILENEMAERWDELRGVIDDYENETRERRRAHEIIRAKDNQERIIIDRQVSTTSMLLDSIRTLNDRIQRFRTSADSKIFEIMAENRFFHDAYQTAKRLFVSEQRRDRRHLVILTREYNLTIDRLRKLIRKGEKLLVLMHNCTKYETEDEKIMQQPVSFMIGPVVMETRQDEIFSDLEELEVFFWRRTGAARIITTELKIEKSRLCEEWHVLRESLNHRLSDIITDIE